MSRNLENELSIENNDENENNEEVINENNNIDEVNDEEEEEDDDDDINDGDEHDYEDSDDEESETPNYLYYRGNIYESENSEDYDVEVDENDCKLQQAMHKHEPTQTILELVELCPMDVAHKNKVTGCYPLHTALDCDYDYGIVAMKLMELNPEVAKHKNSEGVYPLQFAFRNDHCFEQIADVVMMLIEIFPEAISELKTNGTTALNFACRNIRSEALIAKLIKIDPMAIYKMDFYAGIYPIHCAIENGQPIAAIKLLLDGDSPVTVQQRAKGHCNDNVTTSFHLACEPIHYDIIKYSIGHTPLHYACKQLKDNVVDMLLHHPDIDVNATGCSNDTPLHVISVFYCGNLKKGVNIVQKLLNHPFILINQKNSSNKTPLDLVKARLDEYKMLLERTSVRQDFELECTKEMIHLLEDFTMKRRWQAYCYHFNQFMDL